MIESIFPLVSEPVKQCIYWFEQILTSAGALSLYIAGVLAIIITRFLFIPLIRNSVSSVSSASSERKSRLRSNKD